MSKECVDREDVLWLVYTGKIITGDNAGGKVAQELIRELPTVNVQTAEWYSTAERLPNDGVPIYAEVHWIDEGDYSLMYGIRRGESWHLFNFTEGMALKNFSVTRWMPLPELPGVRA